MSENKLKIETKVRRLIYYIEDIEKGLLQIPPFQRDKVWDNNKRKDLLGSIKNGYPIGSILLWKPQDNIFEKSIEKFGPYTVDSTDVDGFFYILDGFQRLSTLFGCLIDPDKIKPKIVNIDKEELRKEFYLCYDLDKEDFFIPRMNNKIEIYQVPIFKLIDTRAAYNLERQLHKQKYSEETIELYIDRYQQLGTTIADYALPAIEIRGGTVEDAVDIFSRVNSKGSIISLDWMVSALSYNKDEKGFRLGTHIDNLVEELKAYNFDSIKREVLLQCIMNSFGKFHFDQMTKSNTSQIEKLVKRNDFVKTTKKAIVNIKKAVKFLFEELLVVDNKLLSYGSQLIFITDFFNQVEKPNKNQLEKLKNWVWITTYSGYFTMYSLSKQREAYNQFQLFLKDENKNPVYNDREDLPFEVTEFPNKIYFGSVRAKSLLLFMLNYTNNFKSVDAQNIEGLNLNYLFYDVRDEKGNFLPESAIVILDTLQAKFPKSRDMSFMLEKYKAEYEHDYFLTEEMSQIFLKKEPNYRLVILEKRRELIIDTERKFVESLDMMYNIWTPSASFL